MHLCVCVFVIAFCFRVPVLFIQTLGDVSERPGRAVMVRSMHDVGN